VNLSGKALAPVAAEDIMTTTISEQRDRTADYDMPADLHLVDSTRTLDGFAFQLRDTSGLDVRALAAGTIVIVRTRHSRYRLMVLEPETQRVLVSGGEWFPVPTEMQLVGSTSGGSMLKPGWLGVGLKVELRRMNRRITTSFVNDVTIEWTPLDAA
jgi:hypothetical protein